MSTQLKINSFKSIELFAQDQSVSKKFPMLASPGLYLDILSEIYVL